MKKMMKIMLGAGVLAIAIGAQADTISWDNGGADGKYSTALNWNTDTVPGSADIARNLAYNMDVIVDTSEAALDLVASKGAGDVAGFKVVTGGTLAIGQDVKLGSSANGTGQLVVDGGTVTIGRYSYVGQAATTQTGIVNLVSGSITASGQMFIGSAGTGFLNVSGGTLTVQDVNLSIGKADGTGVGTFNLTGGDVLTKTLEVNTNSVANLFGGTLTVTGQLTAVAADSIVIDDTTVKWLGNKLAGVDSLVTNGMIALSGDGQTMLSETYDQSWTLDGSTLYADYDNLNAGYTTLWATIPEPATIGLMGVVGAGLLLLRRMKRY